MSKSGLVKIRIHFWILIINPRFNVDVEIMYFSVLDLDIFPSFKTFYKSQRFKKCRTSLLSQLFGHASFAGRQDLSSIWSLFIWFSFSYSKGVRGPAIFAKCGTWQPDPIEVPSSEGSANTEGECAQMICLLIDSMSFRTSGS